MKKLLSVLLMLLMVTICAIGFAETAVPAPVTIDLTGIVTAVLGVLGAILTGYLIPWIKARASKDQLDRISALLRVGVYAAEEIYRSGHGDEKLQYVKDYLAAKGITVDIEQIKAAVKEMRDNEGAVRELTARGE